MIIQEKQAIVSDSIRIKRYNNERWKHIQNKAEKRHNLTAQQVFAGEAAGRAVVSFLDGLDLLARCSMQHPLHDFPHSQVPFGHAHWPPQHSSLGKLTKPNGAPRRLSKAAAGYTMIFIGSMPTPKPILRLLGGAGSAAARAKNWSMMLSLIWLEMDALVDP